MEGICQQLEDAPDHSNGRMDHEANIEHRSNIEGTSNDPVLEPKHKIFLSHSGVQKEFVWHLCEALQQRGHNPFFDKLPSSLPKGERFSELILKAAHQCEIAVVVVSEEYFTSKWPMLELHAFTQAIKKKFNTKLKILPLFYGLSLYEFLDEKRQERWFQMWETWAKVDLKDRIKVGEWMDALDMLRSYNGISYNRELQEIVIYRNDVVSHICNLILPDIKWYDSHVQGKVNICKVFYEKIEHIGHLQDNRANVIGIYGVGGIGKTTFCKILCNGMAAKYEGKICYLEFHSTINSSLVELLQKVLIELTSFSHENLQQLDEGQCKDILWKRISSQRTFLAIDNIWNDSQSIKHAKMILGAPFHKESLVIVTARSWSIIELLGINRDACIEMPELGENDATNLFLFHAACGKQFAEEEEKHDILQCVRRCYFQKGGGRGSHYHPLALEALGLQLGCLGGKPSEWVKHLPRVRNFCYFAGENPVFDILRNGFDLLPPIDQTLFLDVVYYKPFLFPFPSYQLFDMELMEWLCLVYKQDEDEIKNRLDRLKEKGLLQDVDLSTGTINVHDLYYEFAQLELQGKLDEITDLEERRWMYIMNGGFSMLESTPSGGCWQKLIRLGIEEKGSGPLPDNPIQSLEGIQWQCCSNVVLLELSGFRKVHGTLNLKGLKCLRTLQLFEMVGLDRLEGLEGLTNLTYFKWLHDYGRDPTDNGINHVEASNRHTYIGQFPTSLQVLEIKVGVWLQYDSLVRCNNLYKLKLSYVQSGNLDLRNCSSLQSVTLNYVKKLPNLLRGLITGRCESDWRYNTRRTTGVEAAGHCIPLQLVIEFLHYWCLESNETLKLNRLEQLQVLEVSSSVVQGVGESIDLEGLGNLPALRCLKLVRCRIASRLPDLRKSKNLEELNLQGCQMELCEEDIGMLASLPQLQPVLVGDGSVKLDLIRRKVINQSTLRQDFCWESDLGTPTIHITWSGLVFPERVSSELHGKYCERRTRVEVGEGSKMRHHQKRGFKTLN